MVQRYAGRIAPTLKRIRPNAVRALDVPRGYPRVGNGLGGCPKRKEEVPDAWMLTIDITAAGQDWTVDINAGTGIDITIDWGDGVIEWFNSTGQKLHAYTAQGRYYPKITGKFSSDGNIRFGSNSGNQAILKYTSIIPLIPGLLNFRSTFQNCTGLSGSIPSDLFRYCTAVSTYGFYQTFYGCTGLSGSIPANLFRYNTAVSTYGFYVTFQGCTGLSGSIPNDLFRYNTEVSTYGFGATFNGCTGLSGSIPTDLFRYNTLVSTSGFNGTFRGCAGLSGSIPVDLFRYNTLVSTSGFYGTFYACPGLTSIPTDLFRYCTEVSTSGFFGTFCDCRGLTSIPSDLFRYNTLVSTEGFGGTFYACTGLTSVPALLFKYNTFCNSFLSVFENCNKLQLRADLFFDTGEETTRFLNKTVDFTNAMKIGTFTGTQGTAPALWSCDFGTGAATKTDCFDGHSSSSITNNGDIPAEWH